MRKTAEILADPALRGLAEARESEQAGDVVYDADAARVAGRAQAVNGGPYELGMTPSRPGARSHGHYRRMLLPPLLNSSPGRSWTCLTGLA